MLQARQYGLVGTVDLFGFDGKFICVQSGSLEEYVTARDKKY